MSATKLTETDARSSSPDSEETDFERLAERALSRRALLGGVAFGAAAFVAGAGALKPLAALAGGNRFGFDPVAANTLDTITVPRGYRWHVVARWGDPMWSDGAGFDPKTRGTGESQERAFGDNNDGMSLFADRGQNVLVVNNEYVNRSIVYPGGKPGTADDVRKGKAGHGVSVIEIAEVVLAADGRVVVYMGDDERGEFIYRFVGNERYVEGGDNGNLLETGRLFAAKFADGGRGAWMALTPEATGMASLAEICIHTRMAASAIGATTMDRPEWVAANPKKAEIYCCLTNNKNRGRKPNKGGDPTPVGGPNPRAGNLYGQIVRWRPDGGDHLADGFSWDLYVVAGNPAVHSDSNAGSGNVTADNMFNSPDGLAFDSNGMLWIQTDGKYTDKGGFAGQGNNQMLVGDPATGEIRRFMVGPKECEVTGTAWSPDRGTLFVGIQHPGEKGNSHFPDGGDSVPRSAVIAIAREDGGPIG